MAEIRPFKGIRYNANKVSNMAGVICPPYDIISPEFQDRLYQASEYNFVRIEYNRELPSDNEQNSRYTRASGYIAQWLQKGILLADNKPALYLHEHSFTFGGKSYRRMNIIAAVKLEEWDSQIIRPHENIIPRAKSDRMSMLRACQANTSQVMAMYEDPGKVIASILAKQMREMPVIDTSDSWGDKHRVWAMTQPEALRSLQREMMKQAFYIADGHHRYDSALTYKHELMARSGNITGEEGFNFVMISLTDFADPGLVIFPTHRLIRGIAVPVLKEFKNKLKTFFDIQELLLSTPDLWGKVDSLLTGMKPEMQEVKLAISGLEKDKLLILTLRDYQAAAGLMPGSHDDLYKKLDVSLVDHVIMEHLLDFDKDKVEGNLSYVHDRQEAADLVNKGQYQMAFIMNPVKPELIKAIADTGDRMPRKSTYFYPKCPAGLVFYKW